MKAEKINKLNEVFGLSRNVPKTYIRRRTVDDPFLASLKRDKHIILHASSKQGKTCLRRYHVPDEDSVIIQCTRDFSKGRLYQLLLKAANVRVNLIETRVPKKTSATEASGGTEGSLPLLAKAKASVIQLAWWIMASNQSLETDPRSRFHGFRPSMARGFDDHQSSTWAARAAQLKR